MRFGILGAARIAPAAVIDPARTTGAFEIARVAARDVGRASSFADEHGIAGVSATYDELIQADDVDVVYNPLPMSLHAEWTIAALRAGKHVLCEKPFASNAVEAAEMVRVADETGLKLGEAFHYRYHPLFDRVISLVDSGVIGELRHLDAEFAVAISKPDLRWDWDLSGGSTMDLGCYPIHWVRSIVQSEPTVTSAQAIIEPNATSVDRIDAALEAELAWASGVTARISSSMVAPDGPTFNLRVQGSDGHIEVRNPIAPQHGNRVTVSGPTGTTTGEISAGNTYEHMCRAFVDHVRLGSEFVTSGEDSIANMTTIEDCYRAAGLPPRGSSG